MNAKELRQAAEVAVMQWDNHDRHRLVTGDEVLLNSDGEPDEVTFARHILATVREDDDEPVSEERFRSISNSTFCGFPAVLHALGHRGVAWLDYGPAVTFGDDEFDILPVHLATMGQFRSLCRGLGIELKEVSRVD